MDVFSPGSLLRSRQKFARFSENIVGDVMSAIPEMNGVFLVLGVLRKLSDMPRTTTDKGGGGTDSSGGTLMYNSITGRDIRTHTEPYSRGDGARQGGDAQAGHFHPLLTDMRKTALSGPGSSSYLYADRQKNEGNNETGGYWKQEAILL